MGFELYLDPTLHIPYTEYRFLLRVISQCRERPKKVLIMEKLQQDYSCN